MSRVETEATKRMNRQVRARLMAERNRRLIRNVLLVVVASVVMIIVAISNRDTQTVRQSYKSAARLRDALQTEHDERNRLPTAVPHSAPNETVLQNAFDFNVLYPGQIGTTHVVGVCCQKRPLDLYLRGSGRHVITFDGERYKVEWLTDDEFQKRAKALGF